MNAARARNDVVSDRRREKSTWRPQCSEFLPEWDMLPSGGVRIRSVLEATTCGASHVPTGQWMCQSMSLSESMLQLLSAGGIGYPKQPMPAREFRPPSADPTVYPNVSLS